MGRAGRVVITIVIIIIIILFLYFLVTKGTYKNVYLESPKTDTPTTAIIQKDEWKEYKPQSERFVVTLPVIPQHAAQMFPVPDGEGFIRYDMYLAQVRNGGSFMINVIEYPSTFKMTDVESLLKGVMREMLGSNPANKLVQSTPGTFSDNPSLEFLIQNKTTTMKTLTVVKDHTIYVLCTADNTESRTEENFKKLVESFKIQ